MLNDLRSYNQALSHPILKATRCPPTLPQKMKNDLRTEMDMKSRISAAETKAALTPSPTVLVQQPAVAYMPAARERYCGPISLIIGFLIFPCVFSVAKRGVRSRSMGGSQGRLWPAAWACCLVMLSFDVGAPASSQRWRHNVAQAAGPQRRC